MTTISVTAEHIAKGERENCERCPVALAIMDTFPDLYYVRVSPGNIGVSRSESDLLTLLAVPPDVANFIWDYDDNTGAVHPFMFELNYPAEAS